MKKSTPVACALGIGAAAGLIILGLGGRLVTASLAWAWAIPRPKLTPRSVLEPALAGLVAGALAALLLPLLHKRLPQLPAVRRLALGLLPFAVSLAWMLLKGKPDAWMWHSAYTLTAALLLFLLYGLAADSLYGRCVKTTPAPTREE